MIRLKSLIVESKQSIINLGYPEVIASLFYEKFGNLAYVLAKWYKEYSHTNPEGNWFQYSHYNSSHSLGVHSMVTMYNSTDTVEHYLKELERMGLSHDDFDTHDEFYLKRQKELWKKEIEREFFGKTFFKANTLILDIENGTLKDLSPYKDLSFWSASLKYDELRVFKQMTPLKTYSNGYKWINVGRRCHLLAHYMKNCGSAGIMSNDEDRTLLGLFDSNGKPHVIVTYSPNEKRISGEEGVGSSEVKSDYHDYVLDLAKYLGVTFDVGKSKSKVLTLKYLLKDKGSNIKKLDQYSSIFDEYFRFNIGNKIYYTNCYEIVSLDDMKKIRDAIKSKKIKLQHHPRNAIKAAFNHYNKPAIIGLGVKYHNFSQISFNEL